VSLLQLMMEKFRRFLNLLGQITLPQLGEDPCGDNETAATCKQNHFWCWPQNQALDPTTHALHWPLVLTSWVSLGVS